MWGGRFETATDTKFRKFNSSLSFDKALFPYDISGSKAHAKMLYKIGILTETEKRKIIKGLSAIEQKVANEIYVIEEAEDIHSFVEEKLIGEIGEIGKKLHTARSRNDQVCLDLRMYVKDKAQSLMNEILSLMDTLNQKAEKNLDVIFSGMTHLQPAQPVSFAFHLLAYVEMLKRDYQKIENCKKEADVMPLGSGALAGVAYPVDKKFLCKELGFKYYSQNAMDAVSDRDFAVSFVFGISILMMHLSKLAEEIILWSNPNFHCIKLSDSYTTGSSIMPQKKNPDGAELIRGKTGTTYGRLMGLLATLKALPLAYNKDLQEDKVPVFQSYEDAMDSLVCMNAMIDTMYVYEESMKRTTLKGYINATDGADYLVSKGIGFRDAHFIMGRVVLYAVSLERALDDLTLSELKSFSETFDSDYYEWIDMERSLEGRCSEGGTCKKEVAN